MGQTGEKQYVSMISRNPKNDGLCWLPSGSLSRLPLDSVKAEPGARVVC